MLSAILGFLGNGAGSLFGLLLALLPSIDVGSLPIALPEPVTAVMGFANVFIPFADLVSIISWWALLVLALNVFMIVSKVFSSVSK